MTMSLVALISLTALWGAPLPRLPGATPVVEFNFEPAPDRDFLRPDDWTRIIRAGYPFFVDAALTNEAAVSGTRSLVFRLNGGNAAYFSPTSPASRDYNYYLQAQIKTIGLTHNRAFVLLEFLDQRRRLVGSQHLSGPIGGTSDWTAVTIGPIAPDDTSVRYLRIACLVQHPQEMDLTGSVFFDDIWVGRLPRFEIDTSGPFRLFHLDEPKSLSVRVSGVEDRQVDARFRLLDENRKLLREAIEPLEVESPDIGTARWDLPIADVGFYHLDIGLFDGAKQILEEDFPVTVMRPDPGRPASEFGFSAPPPAHGLPNYQRLLDFSASKYLKLPLWGRMEPTSDLYGGGRPLARFLEHMSAREQILVGGLENAPPSVEANLIRPPRGIADIFVLPKEKWVPELEGVIARHGLKVTRWQLGADRDSSFDTLTDFPQTIRTIKGEMDLIARDLRLGTAWNWLVPPPKTEMLAFLSMTDAPTDAQLSPSRTLETWSPMNSEQLLEYLRMRRSPSPTPVLPTIPAPPTQSAAIPPPLLDENSSDQPQLWVQIAPISSATFAREQQVLDLADRILAAKIGDADGIWATRLSDVDHGLIAPDGAPTELFTIWRTLAEHLGGTRYLGQVYAPGKIENYAFGTGGGLGTIVLRGDGPGATELVVGPGAKQTDLWGRTKNLTESSSTAIVQTTGTPILITQISEPLIRFQLQLRFQKGKLPSEFGRQVDSLIIENTFGQTLVGRVAPVFPDEWRVQPEGADLQVAPGQQFVLPLRFDIPQGASQGDFSIPIDFEVAADRPYRFRIFRPYRLGGDEIQVATSSTLLPNGLLEVEMKLTNLTQTPLSLQCDLRAYNHNVVSLVVERLGGGDTTAQSFYLERGRTLLGQKMQLEISEIAGRRQFSFLVNTGTGP